MFPAQHIGVTVTLDDPGFEEKGIDTTGLTDVEKPSVSDAHGILKDLRSLVTSGKGEVYLGVLSGNPPDDTAGLATRPSNPSSIPTSVAVWYTSDVDYKFESGHARNRGSHEFGHVLGQGHSLDDDGHTLCETVEEGEIPETGDPHPYIRNIGGKEWAHLGFETDRLGHIVPDTEVWGIDMRLLYEGLYSIFSGDILQNFESMAIVNPDDVFALMSYCNKTGSSQRRWVSAATYTDFLTVINSVNEWSPPPIGGLSDDRELRTYDLFYGSVVVDDQGKVVEATLDYLDQNQTAASVDVPTYSTGHLELRLISEDGETISSERFSPIWDTTIPMPLDGIAVSMSSSDCRDVPWCNPTRPENRRHNWLVAIVDPREYSQFEIWDGKTLLKSEKIQHSSVRVKNYAELSVAELAADTSVLTLPDVTISGIEEGMIVWDGMYSVAATVEAWASVAEETKQSIEPSNVTWSSSIDGSLGTHADLVIAASDLSHGVHTITATATGPDGRKGSSSVKIYRVDSAAGLIPIDDSYSAEMDKSYTFDVLANDLSLRGSNIYSKSLTISSAPTRGTARIVERNSKKQIEYTAGVVLSGEDSFTYRVCDAATNACVEGQVTVAVSGCTMIGTDKKDGLRGTNGADIICGLGGNDVIYGSGGDDIIYGGDGNDTIHGNDGDDTIYGGAGDDTVNGDGGVDTLHGGAGADTIRGGSGHDKLFGDSDNDVLIGDGGTDTVDGGNGFDRCDAEFVSSCEGPVGFPPPNPGPGPGPRG